MVYKLNGLLLCDEVLKLIIWIQKKKDWFLQADLLVAR